MTQQAAVRSADLIGSFGVDTHINYTDSQYVNISGTLSALQYLGLNHVRDGAPNPNADAVGQVHLANAADAGVKFTFVADDPDPSLVVQRIHAFVAAHPGSVVGIEGPNEVNNSPVTYAGLTGTAAAQAYQKALFDAVNLDPLLKNIPVLGFTDYPAHASDSDWNNTHPYPKNGDQPYNTIVTNLSAQTAVDPGKPFAITEMGYHTSLTADTAGGWEGVNEATQAKLLLNALMDAAALGSRSTSIYQLLDAYADPQGSNQEAHFGLFHLDGSAKPAADAIHNLTSILADAGGTAAGFNSGTLDYSVSGLPSSGHTYLTQKSDGSFQIIAWNEPDIWNETTDAPIAATSTPLTVSLGQNFGTVQVFDPLNGDVAIQTLHNTSSVSLGLVDHPVIIQVSGSSSGAHTASPATGPDFNGDGHADILWRNNIDGTILQWDMNGRTVTSSTVIGGAPNWNVVGTGDFNGDGHTDILYRDSNTGQVVQQDMNDHTVVSSGVIGGDLNWNVVGTGDFNGDGHTDILWRNNIDGTILQWDMNGRTVTSSTVIGGAPNWNVVGTGDFNGDGHTDILYRDSNTGQVVQQDMNDHTVVSSGVIGGDLNWNVVGTGDFNGDGHTDILWRNNIDGTILQWDMNGRTVTSSTVIGGAPNWNVVGTGDFNGDGHTDILYRDSNTGQVVQQDMNDHTVISSGVIGGDLNWNIASDQLFHTV